MSDHKTIDEDSQKPLQPASMEDSLPPVDPPSVGFILQLFVIPAIIVAIIAVVWLMFSWTARMGDSPEQLVGELEMHLGKNSAHSWQVAANLADELAKVANNELKGNTQLAQRLAHLLDSHLDHEYPAGSNKLDVRQRGQAVKLRIFLCRALGEFQVLEVIPTLVRAASQENYLPESDEDLGDPHVRQSAVEAITILSFYAKNEGHLPELLDNELLMQTLLNASAEHSDEGVMAEMRARIRYSVAYCFGVIGSEEIQNQLALMLGDSYANVRFNAATGLARHGDLRSIPVLIEMLDPNNAQIAESEGDESGIELKRVRVLATALQAVRQLAQADPTADLKNLERSVSKLLESDVHLGIKDEAMKVLDHLKGSLR